MVGGASADAGPAPAQVFERPVECADGDEDDEEIEDEDALTIAAE